MKFNFHLVSSDEYFFTRKMEEVCGLGKQVESIPQEKYSGLWRECAAAIRLWASSMD